MGDLLTIWRNFGKYKFPGFSKLRIEPGSPKCPHQKLKSIYTIKKLCKLTETYVTVLL